MQNIVHDEIGLIHVAGAVASLVFGTAVLVMKKGTRRHMQYGYIYTVSMITMLVTSFMIYRLFKGFGLFHFFSILSSITLAGGLIPAIRRQPSNWVEYHFAFMYWSVFGLYAAFVAEIFTRIPGPGFYNMLGVAIFVVMGIGYFFWFKNKKKWAATFGNYESIE